MKCLTFDPPFENPPGYEFGVGVSVINNVRVRLTPTFTIFHDRFT